MVRKLKFRFRYGPQTSIDNSQIENGTFNISTDTERLSVDIEGIGRVRFNDICMYSTEDEIKSLENPSQKLYFAVDTLEFYHYNTDTLVWDSIKIELADRAISDNEGNNIVATYATKAEVDTVSSDLDALKITVGDINRFNIIVLASGESLPESGEQYTIYFVPSDVVDESTGQTKDSYNEFIWLYNESEKSGYFEQIGVTTTDLKDYYNKTEIDQSLESVGNSINTNKSNIETLTTTVDINKTETDKSISNLNTKVTTLEFDDASIKKSIGEYPTAEDTKDITTRLNDLETANTNLSKEVSDNKSTSDTNESNLDTRIKTLETSVGTYPTNGDTKDITNRLSDIEATDSQIQNNLGTLSTTVTSFKETLDNTDSGLDKRITSLETDNTATKKNIGIYPDEEGTKDITTRLRDLETSNTELTNSKSSLEAVDTGFERRISSLENTIGSSSSGEITDVSLSNRISNLEFDNTVTKKALGNYPTSEDTKDITTRLNTIESDASDLSSNVSTYKTNTDSRISTLETYDAALKKAVGNYPTTEDTKDITTRLSDIESAASTLSSTVSTNKTNTDKSISDLTDTVSNNKKSLDETDTNLQSQITELKTSIGNINRFDIKVLDAGQSLPESGESYTIYFVPVGDDGDTNNGKTKFTEYMWIASSDGTGYFEEIGITEAELGEYYTSKQVDSLLETVNSNITDLQTEDSNIKKNIGTYTNENDIATRLDNIESAATALSNTVSSNKESLDKVDSGLDTRIKALETADEEKTTSISDLSTKDTELQSNIDTLSTTVDTTYAKKTSTVSDVAIGDDGSITITKADGTTSSTNPEFDCGDEEDGITPDTPSEENTGDTSTDTGTTTDTGDATSTDTTSTDIQTSEASTDTGEETKSET